MSLDLIKVAVQIGDMVARLKSGRSEREEHLKRALETLHQTTDLDSLQRRVSSSKTTWLVAGLVDGLDRHHRASPLPAEFTVIATDGSHIDIDRHRSTRCCLINIGSVVLHYGAQPDARLDSIPRLYSGEEDLAVSAPGAKAREQAIEGQLLGIKRTIEECRHLAELAADLPPGNPALALLDGSLILWGLEAYPEFVAEALLDKAFRSYLDNMCTRRIALASYISFPRSTDVVNVLRVAICPHEIADCDRYCAAGKTRDCDLVGGVQDRELFSNLLDIGERSALFISPSQVVEQHYGVHQVYFFYLRVEDEIARVEIPRWVALDEALLNLVHTLVLDQCRRGQGYPVALTEAHEKAVVTGADREQFWQLVESSLVDERLPSHYSAKSLSKRTRWL